MSSSNSQDGRWKPLRYSSDDLKQWKVCLHRKNIENPRSSSELKRSLDKPEELKIPYNPDSDLPSVPLFERYNVLANQYGDDLEADTESHSRRRRTRSRSTSRRRSRSPRPSTSRRSRSPRLSTSRRSRSPRPSTSRRSRSTSRRRSRSHSPYRHRHRHSPSSSESRRGHRYDSPPSYRRRDSPSRRRSRTPPRHAPEPIMAGIPPPHPYYPMYPMYDYPYYDGKVYMPPNVAPGPFRPPMYMPRPPPMYRPRMSLSFPRRPAGLVTAMVTPAPGCEEKVLETNVDKEDVH